MAKYQKWRVMIDHAELSTTSYTSSNGTEVSGLMLKVFLKRPDLQSGRSAVKTFFENSDRAIVNRFKDLDGETNESGVKTIEQETIKKALEPGKTEIEPYINPENGIEYESYGMFLASLGTIPKDKRCKKDGRPMYIFGTMPFVKEQEGKELPWFILMNPDGTVKLSKRNGQPYIQQYVDVATEMVITQDLLTDELSWQGSAGSEEESLRREVTNLISRRVWVLQPDLQGTNDADSENTEEDGAADADTGE